MTLLLSHVHGIIGMMLDIDRTFLPSTRAQPHFRTQPHSPQLQNSIPRGPALQNSQYQTSTLALRVAPGRGAVHASQARATEGFKRVQVGQDHSPLGSPTGSEWDTARLDRAVFRSGRAGSAGCRRNDLSMVRLGGLIPVVRGVVSLPDATPNNLPFAVLVTGSFGGTPIPVGRGDAVRLGWIVPKPFCAPSAWDPWFPSPSRSTASTPTLSSAALRTSFSISRA